MPVRRAFPPPDISLRHGIPSQHLTASCHTASCRQAPARPHAPWPVWCRADIPHIFLPPGNIPSVHSKLQGSLRHPRRMPPLSVPVSGTLLLHGLSRMHRADPVPLKIAVDQTSLLPILSYPVPPDSD